MKKNIIKIIVVLVLLLGAVITFVPEAKLYGMVAYHNLIKSSIEFTVEGDKLYMNGYICSKTPNQLKKVIEANPQVTTIVMLEVTGSMDDGAKIGIHSWREMGTNIEAKDIPKDSD